ncbi:MAG: NERD domain-containing protein [Ruminiclostridium sp.]|nr:NERD domain-containing protein [Ruminiclostridium sp.]
MKIYKSRNPNKLKIGALFVMQVIFGVLPAVLFIIFAIDYMTFSADNPEGATTFTNYIGAYISAAAIVLCAIAYFILGRRYNVLLSGIKGEKSLEKIARKHRNEFDIFLNCPIQYKRNRSEVDMIMLGKKGLIIIEVKNHSGTVTGSDTDDKWTQYKHYRDGKTTEGEMKNPIKQITRQRDILKSILHAQGIDIWIDSIVYFSNPLIRLKLSLKSKSSYVCAGEKELEKLLAGYSSPKPISPENVKKIKEILRSLV